MSDKVNVIDSIMGSGKTSWAIQNINEASSIKKFVYITPYLDEVERISQATNREFIEPNNRNEEGSKLFSLKRLLADGKDIVSTHSLFQMADGELLELLTDSGYTLILDEVMDVIEKVKVTPRDIEDLKGFGHIEIKENKVIWTCSDYDIGARYSDVMKLAKSGNLFYHRGTFLIWAFPPSVFSAFSDVYILTYLFDAQIQRYYFDMFEFDYEYFAVEGDGDRYALTDYDKSKEKRKELYSLIDVYEGRHNEVDERPNAFSATQLRNMSPDKEEQIQKAIYSYFRNVVKARSKEILWTTVKSAKAGLAGKGYAKSFLQCNARATNEYQDRWALAYVFNRYLNPMETSFFEDNGITVNQDLLAVSDLLQWVYRSRIRNGEPVQLYLPSSRMRQLLKDWSEYKL